MKAVGEAMGIGRTFQAGAFLKAMRSRELDTTAAAPWRDLDDIPAGVHPWFRAEFDRIRAALGSLIRLALFESRVDWLRLKRLGLVRRGHRASVRRGGGREVRHTSPPIEPVYHPRGLVCGRGHEAASNYLYSTWGEASDAEPPRREEAACRHPRLGAEPDRAGDRVRLLLRPRRGQSLSLARLRGGDGQLQPGDRLHRLRHLDRLYFEPLGARGGARPSASASSRTGIDDPVRRPDAAQARAGTGAAGFPIMGTPHDAVDLAEDREHFARPLRTARYPLPGLGHRPTARRGGRGGRADRLPGLVRASPRAGRAGDAGLLLGRRRARGDAGHPGPTLIDRFLENAIEIDVDALCDGDDTYVAAVMEHVEEAGIHSGDSSCVLPPPSLDDPRDCR